MRAVRSLTGATPITGEFAISRAMIRKRTATPASHTVEQFIAILSREKFGGTITIGMSDGHVRTMSAEDKQTLAD